jgi:hypothetical protein
MSYSLKEVLNLVDEDRAKQAQLAKHKEQEYINRVQAIEDRMEHTVNALRVISNCLCYDQEKQMWCMSRATIEKSPIKVREILKGFLSNVPI